MKYMDHCCGIPTHSRGLKFRMKKLGSFWILSAVALLMFAPQGWVLAQEEETSAEVSKEDLVEAESSTCHTTLASGSGSKYLKICISNHGNLMQFESPYGSGDHIAQEGYALCSGQYVFGYDSGVYEAGCGNPTISQPNGPNTLPLTITRNCGCVNFKQVFARDTAEKDVTITMTFKNNCGYTIFDALLCRYFDGDMNGDSRDDIYDRTIDTVYARDGGYNGDGLSLTDLSFAASGGFIERYSDWSHDIGGGAKKCGGLWQNVYPTALGDYVGRQTYYFGAMASGVSKTVKVVYRRY